MNKSGFIVYILIVAIALVFLLTASGLMAYLKFSDQGIEIVNSSAKVQQKPNPANASNSTLVPEDNATTYPRYDSDYKGISVKEIP